MNKKALLITSIAAVFAVGVGTITLSGLNQIQRANELRAAPTTAEHTITLTASDIYSSSVDDKNTPYYAEFMLWQEDATRNGDDFGFMGYAYGDISASCGNGKIFTIEATEESYGNYSYINGYFGMTIDFKNVYSYSSIILNGEFYYTDDLLNPETSKTYTFSDFIDDKTLVIYEGDLFKAVLTSVVITYNCVI